MAEQLKIAFKQRISEKDWLDETTKNKTIEKVTQNFAQTNVIRLINLMNDEIITLELK